jgi:hypothetical protein
MVSPEHLGHSRPTGRKRYRRIKGDISIASHKPVTSNQNITPSSNHTPADSPAVMLYTPSPTLIRRISAVPMDGLPLPFPLSEKARSRPEGGHARAEPRKVLS